MRFPWQPEPPKTFSFPTRAGTIQGRVVDKNLAFEEWKKAVELFPQTGKWPLIVPNPGEGQTFAAFGDFDPEEAPSDVVESAREINPDEFIQERLKDYEEEAEDDGDEEFIEATQEMKVTDPSALEVPSAPYGESLILTSKPSEASKVGIVELPMEFPWQLTALRPFGGWNEVPEDEELTSVFKSWFDRYGAVPLAFSNDTIELWLDQPLTDPVDAVTVALEQYAICRDIVEQGTDTVQELAQNLLNNRIWFFWWD